MRRNVELSKGWYKDAFGAMLCIRKETKEAVALIPSSSRGYHFYDSKTEKEVQVNSRNEGQFETEAIAFYIPFPLEKLTVRRLIGYIFSTISPADMGMISVLMLAGTLLGMIMPFINKWLFSVVVFSEDAMPLVSTAVFLLCVVLSSLLISTVKTLSAIRINTKLHTSVEAAAMMRILSLPADFFKKYSPGDLANRSAYISSLCDLIVNSVLTTGISGVFSLIYIVQIFVYTPALVAPALLNILLITVVSVVSSIWQISIAKHRMEISAKESGMTYSLISGIQKIKLSGAEKELLQSGEQFTQKRLHWSMIRLCF